MHLLALVTWYILFPSFTEVVTQIAFSQDCKYLYTVSGDSCIFVWKLSREITQVHVGCMDVVDVFSVDSTHLVTQLITLCTCARGEAISSVIVVVIVNKKIARSRHLGTLAIRKHNKSVDFGEKLASLCFESSGMAYKRHK